MSINQKLPFQSIAISLFLNHVNLFVGAKHFEYFSLIYLFIYPIIVLGSWKENEVAGSVVFSHSNPA